MLTRLVVLICLSLISVSSTSGQPPFTILSDAFETPDIRDLNPKIIQTSNGNTLLMTLNKEGLKVLVFDSTRRLIVTGVSKGEVWDERDMKFASIRAIFELNRRVNFFLQQEKGLTPTLFRLEIDATSGKIIAEKKVGEMIKYRMGDGVSMSPSDQKPKKFIVEKDPYSEYYAILKFDPFARADENRIELSHFDRNHEEINKAVYESAGAKKYFNYLSLVVNGDREIFLASYDYNTRSSGGKSAQIIFSKLEKGKTEFQHKVVRSIGEIKNTVGAMIYVPSAKRVELLTVSQEEMKSNGSVMVIKYSSLLTKIDPENFFILTSQSLSISKLTEYRQKTLKQKEGFSGTPRGIILNPDNSTTILFHEEVYTRKTNAYSVGALNLDEQGAEKNGLVFWYPGFSQTNPSFFALNDKMKGVQNQIGFGELSFDYAGTSTGNQYFFFNEAPQNANAVEDDLPRYLENRQESARNEYMPVVYKVSSGKKEKFPMLGNSYKEQFPTANFISADYNMQKQTYAVLIQESGRVRKAKVAWLKLD